MLRTESKTVPTYFDKNSSDAGSSVISNDLKRRANDA